MKNRLFSTIFLITMCLVSNAGVLIVEGKYQNKNLFVQNGFGGSGIGYCAFQVRVNGQVTTDEVNSTAFEVDLMAFKLQMGDKVVIEIEHKEGCQPRILNPDALKPSPTYEITSISITTDGLLKWKAKNEGGALPYVVEQYKWNKWVYAGEVPGVGTPEENSYSFRVNAHSGENKYRLKQIGSGYNPRLSMNVSYSSLMEKPNYQVTQDGKEIRFSTETAYEVYDYYGSVVKKGYEKSIDLENLKRGKYFLCYDNAVTEIEKKK